MKNNKKTTSLRSVAMKAMSMNDGALGANTIRLESDDPKNYSGQDLTGQNLSGQDLTGANLSNANLFRTNLTGANLTGANLSNANFFRANLTGANFFRANLTGANFSEAIFLNTICPNGNNTSSGCQ